MERTEQDHFAKAGAYGREKRLALETMAERLHRERIAKIKQDNTRLIELAQEKEQRRQKLLLQLSPLPTHSSVCKKRTKRTVSDAETVPLHDSPPAQHGTAVTTGRGKTRSLFHAIEQKSGVYEAELLKELRFEELAESSDEERTVLPKAKNHKTMSEVTVSPAFSAVSRGGQMPPLEKHDSTAHAHAKSFSHSPHFPKKTLSPLHRKHKVSLSPVPAKPDRQVMLEKSIEELNARLEKLRQRRLRRRNKPQRHSSKGLAV